MPKSGERVPGTAIPPWEGAPSTGDEAAPLPGTAAWHEDHVTLHVALAFVFHADITGDADFLRTRAWSVLSGVANWLESCVTNTSMAGHFFASLVVAVRLIPMVRTAP